MVKIESFKTGAMKRLVGPGEFKTIMYVNYHRYAPGETHEIHSHDDREEVFICIGGRGRLVGGTFKETSERETSSWSRHMRPMDSSPTPRIPWNISAWAVYVPRDRTDPN